MATEEHENNNIIDVEPIVNRWIVDYYYCLALELLKNKQKADFRAICRAVDSIFERQLEDSDHLSLKIRLLQFLSRINEADKPDQLFDSDQTTTPLESALQLLEKLTEEFIIPRQSYVNACTSLKEMIVGTFIKNNQFDKAKDAVIQYYPKSMSDKRTIYMIAISQKNKAHPIIKQLSFQRFMGQMLDFCQRLCPFTVPFICKAAQSLAEKRVVEPDDEAARTDEQDQPSCSSCPKASTFQLRFCEHSIIQKVRLEVTYNALAKGSCEKSFEQLEEEVEREALEKEDLCLQPSGDPVPATNLNLEQEVGLQRDTSSPMEASPAEQHPQSDADPQTQAGSLSLYTVSRLVVEPDSQPCSQCTSVPEELESEVRTETPPQTVSSKDLLDTQCPVRDNEVFIPRRKLPRRSNRTSNRPQNPIAESCSDSEEESHGPVENKKSNGGDLHHQSNRSSSRKSKRPTLESEDSPQECSTPCRTPEQKQAEPLSRCSPTKKSKRPSLESEDSPQECSTPCRTPEQKQTEPLSRCSPTKGDVEDISVSDSSSDNSSTVSSRHPVPQKKSTPHKGTQSEVPLNLKWKELVKEAKESKDTWSDEELHFTSKKSSSPRSSRSNLSIASNSGQRRKLWTESETQKLKEGVEKFGEGNWSKIKAYYSFTDRTNVNLKDRWRTMKKVNLV